MFMCRPPEPFAGTSRQWCSAWKSSRILGIPSISSPAQKNNSRLSDAQVAGLNQTSCGYSKAVGCQLVVASLFDHLASFGGVKVDHMWCPFTIEVAASRCELAPLTHLTPSRNLSTALPLRGIAIMSIIRLGYADGLCSGKP